MDPLTGAALAGLGGSLFASAGSIVSSERQMKFQERMSNTALQRMVKDARAAGINPLHMAGAGGASTPSGSTFDVGNPAESALSAKRSAQEFRIGKQQELSLNRDKQIKDLEVFRLQLLNGYDPKTGGTVPGSFLDSEIQSARSAAREADARARLAERDADMGTSRGGEALEWARRLTQALTGGQGIMPILPLRGLGKQSTRTVEHRHRRVN